MLQADRANDMLAAAERCRSIALPRVRDSPTIIDTGEPTRHRRLA
jgi:hypothetical protein